MIKIGVAGAYGAFGLKHLDALANIPDAKVTAVFGPNKDKIDGLASERNIPAACTNYEDFLNQDVDAVILSTPTQLHAEQSVQAMRAGKHTFAEIPMADSLADAQTMDAAQKETGVTGMVGHVRRFNPSHQWIRQRIDAGEFNIQQMDAQTYFFRRTNTNAKGEPRSWTDHLLWHHACHTCLLYTSPSPRDS